MSIPPIHLTFSAYSDVGKIRSNNEDSISIFNLDTNSEITAGCDEVQSKQNGTLFLLADGMGGCNSGELASQMTIEGITSKIQNSLSLNPVKSTDDYKSLIQWAILSTHEEVLEHSEDNPEHFGMGSTITLLWLVDGKAILGHVGDSRFYLLRDDFLEMLSNDHSPVGKLYQQGMISAEEARNHPNRNLIDQAIGACIESINPEVQIFDIQKGDGLLLCSDGLSDSLAHFEIEELFSGLTSDSIEENTENLLYAANDADGSDNISLISIFVH